ncbi:MAG: FAD-dependent oxidoreductase, partial [Nocardioidaceae bacterium]
MGAVNRVVIVGGGPGGYESALVAAQLGAEVTVVDSDGIGGSAVLTDCVPSKTLIATAELMADMEEAVELGINLGDPAAGVSVDLLRVNERVKELALAQSGDIERRLTREKVRVIRARGRLDGPHKVVAELADGTTETLEADAVLVATGASPRTLETARPDGERILSWDQVYD